MRYGHSGGTAAWDADIGAPNDPALPAGHATGRGRPRFAKGIAKALPVVLAAAIAASSPARADIVAGWDVTPVPAADNVCTAQRSEGSKYLTLAFDKDDADKLRLVVEMGNTAWTLEPITALAAPMVVGTDVSADNTRWDVITPTSLFTWSVKPDKMVADLKAASGVGIRFPKGKQEDTMVGLTGFTQALPLLQACQAKMK